MAHRGFTTCTAGNDKEGTTAAWAKFIKWTGSVPARSTTGNHGNKFSMFCQNSVGLRSTNFVDEMPDDAWGWFTADLYLGAMEVESTWLILSADYFISSALTLLGVMVERDTAGAGSGLKFHLAKFNFDAFGAPENYTKIADNGSFPYTAASIKRIQVRQYYNSGDDNMDCEVWLEEDGGGTSKIIDEIDIAKIAGKDWDTTSRWTVSQFEETSGKGGANFDAHWGGFIWNDELSGVGPSAQPAYKKVVCSYQFRADTDDAARDDFTGDDGTKKKYRHVDDDYAAVEDTFVYAGHDITDEQELKCDEHVQIGGGTATIDALYVTAQVFDALPTPAAKATELQAAIHCTGGATWTTTIFDTLFAIFQRKSIASSGTSTSTTETLSSDTSTSTDATHLNDTGADFVADGVTSGDWLESGGSTLEITAVAAQSLTGSGGWVGGDPGSPVAYDVYSPRLSDTGATFSSDGVIVGDYVASGGSTMVVESRTETVIMGSGSAAWVGGDPGTGTYTVDADLRIYQAFVVVLGDDLENAADNPDSNDADATPSGEVSSFVQSLTSALDNSFFAADFDAPPAAPSVTFVAQVIGPY